MKRTTFLTIALLIYSLSIQAQDALKTLKVDINNNAIVDIFKPTTNSLEMSIDNIKYSISFEALGFERLSDLSITNNVLKIGGYMDGTGGYTYTYKFRNNKNSNKIELIGYDSFYKWPSGNLNKSFNAITGNYEVIVQQYIEQKEEMETTKHVGKFELKKILLTNLKNSELEKLNTIGKQYEPE
jgi:hypothetical protein